MAPLQCCTTCAKHQVLTNFLKDTTNANSKVFKTCHACRQQHANRRSAARQQSEADAARQQSEADTAPLAKADAAIQLPMDPLHFCSRCAKHLPLNTFLEDTANLNINVPRCCLSCRQQQASLRHTARQRSEADAASQPPALRRRIDSDTPATPAPTAALPFRPSPQRPSYPPSPIMQPVCPAAALAFLPANQWAWIQSFHTAMAAVSMDKCSRCKERWFLMNLRDGVCSACALRGSQVPALMSAENEMDPGEVPSYLPKLTQIEEMIIARCHVQMSLFRRRGHQYHYTGHCISFMQNTARIVDVLPNLPSELDIVLLQPLGQGGRNEQIQRQFRGDFRVRRQAVTEWLLFLKSHHPDYRHVTIASDRILALHADSDVSGSFAFVEESSEQVLDTAVEELLADNVPPAQSMVPNLNVSQTEEDLILENIRGATVTLPAPSIRSTPIEEVIHTPQAP